MSFIQDILESIVGLKTVCIDISSQKVLAATTDYAAEDVLSNAASDGSYFTFEGMAKKANGSGTIEKAIAFISTTSLTPRVTLFLFRQPPTSNLNDNAANTAVSTNDYPVSAGWLDFLAMEDLGGMSQSILVPGYGNMPLKYKTMNSTSLYGIAVVRDAVTGETAGMVLGFLLTTVLD